MKKEKSIYLDISQIYLIAHEMDNNENIKEDPVFKKFFEYVFMKSVKISYTPAIMKKMIPTTKKYKVSEELFEYLNEKLPFDLNSLEAKLDGRFLELYNDYQHQKVLNK